MHYFIRNIVNVLLIVILPFFTGCATVNWSNDAWFGTDKLYHFTASGIIGAGSTAVAHSNGASDYNAPVIGVSVTIGIGAGKEFYDLTIKETYWSWKDMFWDLIGGSVGSYAVSKYK